MKNLLITLMLILIPTMGMAAKWLKLGEQDGTTYYIYSEVKKENGNYLAWIKTTYDNEAARLEAMKQYNQKKMPYGHINLYCFDSTWSKLCVKETQSVDAEGNLFDTYSADGFDWVYISPESAGEAWGQAARFIVEHPDKIPAE